MSSEGLKSSFKSLAIISPCGLSGTPCSNLLNVSKRLSKPAKILRQVQSPANTLSVIADMRNRKGNPGVSEDVHKRKEHLKMFASTSMAPK